MEKKESRTGMPLNKTVVDHWISEYLDKLIGAIQEELHTDKNACDHHGTDHDTCHSNDGRLFSTHTRLLSFFFFNTVRPRLK